MKCIENTPLFILAISYCIIVDDQYNILWQWKICFGKSHSNIKFLRKLSEKWWSIMFREMKSKLFWRYFYLLPLLIWGDFVINITCINPWKRSFVYRIMLPLWTLQFIFTLMGLIKFLVTLWVSVSIKRLLWPHEHLVPWK